MSFLLLCFVFLSVLSSPCMLSDVFSRNTLQVVEGTVLFTRGDTTGVHLHLKVIEVTAVLQVFLLPGF